MPDGEPSTTSWQPSERFDEAVQFAIEVHRGDTRKGSKVPYVAHLFGVCALVLEEDGDEDQAIAALLHDTAEDHGGRKMLARVEEQFGERVTRIVEALSDTLEDPKPEWRPRKEAYLKRLEAETDSALLVSLADKLYNARAMTRDYKLVGERLWDRFSTGREEQLWYYSSLCRIFCARAPDVPLTQEFSNVVRELEGLVAAQR